jgi:hypothetical protein
MCVFRITTNQEFQMGIRVDIDTDFGVPARYWNIGGRGEDFRGLGTEVTMYGWANKQARDDGKQPLAVKKIQFIAGEYAPEMTRKQLYDKIKTNKDFLNAMDDLTASSEVISAAPPQTPPGFGVNSASTVGAALPPAVGE